MSTARILMSRYTASRYERISACDNVIATSPFMVAQRDLWTLGMAVAETSQQFVGLAGESSKRVVQSRDSDRGRSTKNHERSRRSRRRIDMNIKSLPCGSVRCDLFLLLYLHPTYLENEHSLVS